MKKLIALLAVCGFAFAFAACGKKTDETANEPAQEETTPAPAPAEEAPADTTSTPADTTGK